LEGSEALVRVTLHALEYPDFQQAWEKAVRDGADIVAAGVTGARMAGRRHGNVTWDACVPCPDGMEAADAESAYRHAVRAEVLRRLEAAAREDR
jgi:hypothetical protein